MVVDKVVGGNNKCPHTPVGIEVCHTSVVVGFMDRGEWWYQSVRLLSETSPVCLGQIAQVWEDQELQCISTLTVHR
jgi:hypothetical protein